MNVPSNDLFNLIGSLTMSEKLYFKKYCSIHTGRNDKNYLKLYKEIEKQVRSLRGYDEEKIKEKFRNEKFVKQLHVTKNYLYDLILKSLSSQHSYSSELSELYVIINSIHQLHRKELLLQAEKLIKKGKKISGENEFFPELIRLLDYEIMLQREIFFRFKGKLEQYNIKETFDEILRTTELINNYYEYDWLLRKIYTVHAKNIKLDTGTELKKFKSIINDPLFNDEKRALSYAAKTFYYLAKSNYYSIIGDKEMDFKLNKKLLVFIELHPEKSRKKMNQYLGVLNNILISCFDNNLSEEHSMYLDKVKKLYDFKDDSKIKKFKHTIYRVYFLHFLTHLFLTNNFKKENEIVKKLESDLEHYKDKISILFVHNIYYLLSQYYFIIHDFEKALYYNNIVVNEKETEKLSEFYLLNLYMNLVIHYELKNFDMVENLCRSAYYFLKKNGKLNKSTSNFLKLLNSLLSVTSKMEEQKIFETFQDESQKLERELMTDESIKLFWVLKPWVNSKIR